MHSGIEVHQSVTKSDVRVGSSGNLCTVYNKIMFVSDHESDAFHPHVQTQMQLRVFCGVCDTQKICVKISYQLSTNSKSLVAGMIRMKLEQKEQPLSSNLILAHAS